MSGVLRRLALWFRRLVFAALVALLPWVACPVSTSSLYMMYYTVHPRRYPPRDPARDPSRALSMSITVEAGLLGRAERVEVFIASSRSSLASSARSSRSSSS